MLALLGWNDGTSKEIFTKEELIQQFTIERIHKGGAKFDFEKAKWYNQEWIKSSDNELLLPLVKSILEKSGIHADSKILSKVISITKERCHLLNDFVAQLKYFFTEPTDIDVDAVKPKWDMNKSTFFHTLIKEMNNIPNWTAEEIEKCFKETASGLQLKPGDVQLPFRVMLVGGKFGPAVFEISSIIGKDSTIRRIQQGIDLFNK
jgi:glutamyl-tRNA synthetase